MGATDIKWELEEGIPQVDDPFIQQYLRGRTSLVAEEQKQRHDFTLQKALTPIAATACKIVSKIRAHDLKQLRSARGAKQDASSSHHPDSLTVPQGRERVEKTDLWRILQRMPKGSLLHARLDTTVDLDFLLDLAFTTSGLGIAAPRPFVVESDYDSSPFYFRFATPSDEEGDSKPTLWESAYQPSTVIPLQKAANAFPDGGESGFRDWVKSRSLMQTSGTLELPEVEHAPNDPDTPIAIVNSLLSYEPLLRACLRRLFTQLAADSIRYVELRHAFDIPFRRENSEDHEDEYCADWCRVFQEEVNSFQATEEGKSFYGARVIWTCSRIASNRSIFDDMVRCVLAKTDYPEVISGFDVVAQDCNRPLTELVPILFWFRRQCMEEGVEVPFFFHAGEQFSDTAPPESNAFDAVLLGARRIGQGLSLYRHPLLTELTKEKKILLECCPIPSAGESPSCDSSYASLSALLSRGASVSLCSDPPGLRRHGANDMTTKLWQTLEHCEDVGLSGLAQMAENSIRWSCYADLSTTEWMAGIREGILGEGVKAARLRDWYADYEKFYEWIALEFAELVEDDFED